MAQKTFRIWVNRHAIVFSCIGVAVLVAVLLLGSGSAALHLNVLIVLLLFLGIPHGALDYALAKQYLRPKLGRSWAIRFVAVYISIMGIVLAVWWIYPMPSFIAFLALTLYHFGKGDAIITHSTPLVIRVAEILGRGGAVITLPAVLSRQEILTLFSYLVPSSNVPAIISMLAALMPFFMVCLLICVVWSLFNFVRRKHTIDLVRVAEIVVLAALFSLLPALLAFAVYFSFLHSVRHMLFLSAGGATGSAFSALTGMIRTALPVTAVTFILGGAAYLMLSGTTYNLSQLVRIIFIGIAGMTYPHALVVALAEHVGAIPLLGDVRPKWSEATFG